MQQEVDVRDQLLAGLSDICTAERSFVDQSKLFCFKVPGDKAEDVWMRLRENDDRGFWPVILGTEDDCDELVYAANNPEELGFTSTEDILKKALDIDATEWFSQRYGKEPEFFQTDESQPDTDLSPLNAIAKKYQFYSLVDLQKEYHPEIHLALIPTRNVWEVPAHLLYGGWNDCPMPEEHTAVFKYWHENYGAEVFSIAGDVVEMHVTRPPKTRGEAMDLAREQFIYCSDIVHQGTRTIHALADEIIDSSGWFFWWD